MGKIRREGDKMVEVRRWSAILAYKDIHEKTVVVDDEHHDPPWDDCDGFEHEAKRMNRIEESPGWAHFDGEKYVKHWNPDDVARVGMYDHRLILVSKEQAAKWGNAKYAHARGASKQVAAELEAAERRRTIDQLVKWYTDGWRYYGVECQHPLCKRHGVHESIWGIDDEEYADKDVRHEIARQAAREFEKLGYTVTGIPSRRATREHKQDTLRHKIAYNLGFKTPEEYLAWLAKKGWKGRPRGSATVAASSWST